MSGKRSGDSVGDAVPASPDRRAQVVEHYEEQLRQHGPTAAGMNWKDVASQKLRFQVLTQGLELSQAKIHDVGAGAGHFYDYLCEEGIEVEYSGSDLSLEMVEAARRRHPGARFYNEDALDLKSAAAQDYDYLFCSGLFHVKLDCPDLEWGAFVHRAVRRMYALCGIGIAFNMMSDRVDYRNDRLYHSDPDAMQAFCEDLGGRVVVLDDYPLYEYTVHVFKQEARRR